MTAYDERLAKLRSGMRAQDIDTLILTPGAAMRYLTGFSDPGHERLLALVVTLTEGPLFITPSLNSAQTRANPAGIAEVLVWDDAQGWEALLSDLVVERSLDIGTIAVDDEMPARFTVAIHRLLPTTPLRLAGQVVAPLRAAKDTLELAAMQHAADATDALIPIAHAACRIGATEMSVAGAIQSALGEAGHEPSFEPIVATGSNGAQPHHRTGKSRIKAGDVLVLDFGARVEDYCGDITRVVAVGEPSDEARSVYDVVYRAQQAGVAAVVPGATAHDVDSASRQVIADAGYGEFFLHRTGHGIGLECHEAPNVIYGNRSPLQPGYCFSIEPGIYLPGKFGIRLENIVTVTAEGGARILNQAIPPELPVIEP